MRAPLGADITGEQQIFSLTDGGLPAAVETPTNFVTAYIGKTEKSQAIWIVAAPRNQLQARLQ
jgi:hypothetical protein